MLTLGHEVEGGFRTPADSDVLQVCKCCVGNTRDGVNDLNRRGPREGEDPPNFQLGAAVTLVAFCSGDRRGFKMGQGEASRERDSPSACL